ncbi:hypothetical protein FACS1894103_5310 [Campylobacterota bacterium]|nr:hypothetical protein FACS1894103_5310 [Campylobacterota bacterium]
MGRISRAWLFAGISAVVVISTAVYFIYFAPLAYNAYDNPLDDDEVLSASVVVRIDEPLLPLFKPINLNERKIELGVALFHDPRLSKDDTVSCASCHDLLVGGVDRLVHSVGIEGKEGDVNAPSVYNSSLSYVQFWDGRAKDLYEQAVGPIYNPVEMAATWEIVLPKLLADEDLVDHFRSIYNEPPNAVNVVDAIVEFERSLITPSRMDRWLLGDDNAITAEELEGYRTFVRYGCVACHQGVGVGGNMMQRFGIMYDYYADTDVVVKSDMGRFNVTGREEDKFVFKVPTLRNAALTPPYFHDGSAATLPDAVARMGLMQLGVELPREDVESITRFLLTLNGEDLR